MAPLIIGLILAPTAENSLRQALVISMGKLHHVYDAAHLGNHSGNCALVVAAAGGVDGGAAKNSLLAQATKNPRLVSGGFDF